MPALSRCVWGHGCCARKPPGWRCWRPCRCSTATWGVSKMFESAELGHAVVRASFKAAVPALREALLEAQCELVAERRFSVLILISGVDGSGKGETVNLLHAWMDPRHLVTEAFAEPSDEAAARPPLWRYWRALPPKGKIGFFHGSWYSEPIARRGEG